MFKLETVVQRSWWTSWALMASLLVFSGASVKGGGDGKKVGTKIERFLQKWMRFMENARIQDAIITVEVDQLNSRLQKRLPPGVPMPQPTVYWKYPNKIAYKVLLPNASPEMEMMLQASGIDGELRKMVKQFRIDSSIEMMMNRTISEKEAKKLLELEKTKPDNVKFKIFKDGFKLKVEDHPSGSGSEHLLVFNKKLQLIGYERKKKGTVMWRGKIKWGEVKAEDGKTYPFIKSAKVDEFNPKTKTFDHYDMRFNDVQLNTGLDDALFEETD